MITSPAWTGKRYAIMGLARSGMATLDALVAAGAEVLAWDDREEVRASVADRVALGDPMECDLTGYEALVVSPGVPLNRHPIKGKAAREGVAIIGDIELFAQARAELPAHRVVGITGTNGKSTTTALIHHICQTAGLPTLMGGNIGLPILGQEPLPEEGVYVLELSSYQIDLTQTLNCDVAVLLNVTPDHLDRYAGFEDYAASKGRLLQMQGQDHVAVVSKATEAGANLAEGLDQTVIYVDAAAHPEDQSAWPALQGPHNLENLQCARAACEQLGIDGETIERALRSFGGLPHRMELIGEAGGVRFINDSKATNPASSAPALAAFERIHWIVGGKPKGNSLDECGDHLDHVSHAYTIGEGGPMFAALLEPHMPVSQCGTIPEAVDAAFGNATFGDTILLSPASASFDQFKDFEARGECFRDAVKRHLAATVQGGRE